MGIGFKWKETDFRKEATLSGLGLRVDSLRGFRKDSCSARREGTQIGDGSGNSPMEGIQKGRRSQEAVIKRMESNPPRSEKGPS